MQTLPAHTDGTSRRSPLLRFFARQALALLLYAVIFGLAVVSFMAVNRQELLRRAVIVQLRYVLKRNVTLQEVTLDPRGRVLATGLVVYDGLRSTRRLWAAERIDMRFDPLSLVASPRMPLSAIRRVSVDAPYLVIARSRAGAWNFADLIKPRKETKDRFAAEVIVRNGEVIYLDEHGFLPNSPPLREHLVRINAHTTAAGQRYLPFTLSALSLGGHLHDFSVTGSVQWKGLRSQCEVELGAVKLATLQAYLPARLPLTLTAGTADARVQINLAQNALTHATDAQATLVADVQEITGAVTLPSGRVPCTLDHGELRYADGSVELVGGEGTLNGIPLRCDGSVTNFSNPILALQATTAGTPIARVIDLIPQLKELPYTFGGTVDGSAEITGTLQHIQVSAQANGPSVHAPFGDFEGVKGKISYDSGAFQVTEMSGRGFGGELTGDLWLLNDPRHSQRLLVKGEVNGVSLQRVLRQYLPEVGSGPAPAFSLRDIDGNLSGPITIEVAKDNRVNITTRARGHVEVAGLAQGEVDASLQIEANGDRVTTNIERLEARTPDGLLQAQGVVSEDHELNLAVQGSELDLAALGGYLQQRDLHGAGFATGTLRGPLDRLQFAGTLQVKDGRYAEHDFSDLYSDVSAELSANPKIELSHAHLIAGGSRVNVPGLRIVADPSRNTWSTEGKVELPRTTLASLGKALGTKLPLDGLVDGSADFALSPDNPMAGGTLQLHHPVLHAGEKDVEFDSAKLRFMLAPEGITIADAELVYKDTPFHATGSVTLDKTTHAPMHVALALQARDVSLSTFTRQVEARDAGEVSLTPDLRAALPLDLHGHINLDAQLSADVPHEITPATLADALTVSLTVTQSDGLEIGGVPYRDFAAGVEYLTPNKAAARFGSGLRAPMLLLRQFNLARAGSAKDYRLALPADTVGRLRLDNDEINLNLVLDAEGSTGGADFAQLRRDVLAMCASAPGDSPLAGLQKALDGVPQPFTGAGTLEIGVSSGIAQPTLTAKLAVHDLMVGGNAMPDIAGTLSYDTAPRVLTIVDRLEASGGSYHDAVADLTGSVVLPVKDAAGNTVESGDLNLMFQAMNVDPGMLGIWMRNEQLQQVKGQATIVATIGGDTAHPQVEGSVDVQNLAFGTVQFDNLSAILALENDRLWIGRSGEKDDRVATLQFKGADRAKIEPLEFYGYLPVTWLGSLHPDIATDKPLYFSLNLPYQGLDVLTSYLPQPPAAEKTVSASAPREHAALPAADDPAFAAHYASLVETTGAAKAAAPAEPKDAPAPVQHLLFALPENGSWKDAFRVGLPVEPGSAGHIQGRLEIRGTRLQPEIVNGVIKADAPEVILPVADSDLPDRLRDINIDLGFHTERAGGAWVNTLVVNDCSAIYDRASKAVVKKPRMAWLQKLFGTYQQEQPFTPGAVVAQGDVTLDINQDFHFNDMVQRLKYDIYAKLLRAPVGWHNMFRGTVSSYLRLGNEPATNQPQITGVIYAENAHVTYAGAEEETTPAPPPHLSFNPSLNIAVQFGKGNIFEITPDNPLYRNALSARLPFLPTALFPPISVADLSYKNGMKPPIDRQHPAYTYTADTLQPYEETSTCARLTGTLDNPDFAATFVLQPGKSQVQLPGGMLTVQQAKGRLDLKPFSGQMPLLYANGTATGSLDEYAIKMRLDGNILEPSPTGFPATFNVESAPQGSPILSSNEIQQRLIGLTDFATLLQGKQPFMTSVSKIGPRVLFGSLFDKLAKGTGLETFNLSLDPTLHPQWMVVTPDVKLASFGSVRLGMKSTSGDLPTWKLWGDYKVPDYKFIHNLTISADTNERHENKISIQIQKEF